MDSSLLERIAEIATEAPDRPAVDEDGHILTYQELVGSANRITERLREAGVGPGMLVGLAFDRTAEAIAAILGILGAGAGYVPIDPRYPEDRIDHTLNDADVCLILADRHGAEVVASLDRPTLFLGGRTVVGDGSAIPSARTIENIAYVIYTSGSTGRPKGVAIDRSALAAYASALRDRIGILPSDRYLHTASLAFSSSVRQWVVPLTAGATIVMAGRHHVADARGLLGLVRERRATVADLVPSYVRSCIGVLLSEDPGARRELMDNELRLLLTASEPLPTSVVHAWRGTLGHPAHLINMFGQTETAGIVATYEIPDSLPETGIVPIGKPLPGVEMAVVDECGEAVEAEGSGELIVRGATLAMGYVGLDDTTRERFATVESGPFAGTRTYRTGDRVRHRSDGAMDFLGRRDTQVKVRGHRVELEEVEARLVAHPHVAHAAVVARKGPDGETRLAAVVEAAPGADPDPRAVRRFVAAGLPEYMVPAAVVRVDVLPRTPNGKVDRSALPDVDSARLQLSRTHRPPETPSERRVAALWSELLGVPDVGADDDFFELGGHSLLAMRMVARLRSERDGQVPVRLLFEHPTLSDFAAALDRPDMIGFGLNRPPLEPRTGGEAGPSFAQQRLWLLHQIDRESAAYNLVAAIRLVGPLDQAAMERAVEGVLQRHEALRTVFPNVAGRPGAVVSRTPTVSLPPVPVADEGAMVERVREFAGAPYDLEEGPLFRYDLLQLGEEEHVLALGMHHIVSDGWSRGILHDELARLYEAFASGGDSPLPPLRIQYADYAAWHEAWFAENGLSDQKDWWVSALAGAPQTSELPVQHPRPAMQTFAGRTLTFPVSEDLASEVRRLGAEESASPFMVYLAAFAALLGTYASQDDVVIGTPTAGRSDPDTEGLIGFFVNTLPIRVDLDGAPTFRELVRRAREVSLGAFANQDISFDRVIEALNLPRDLGRSPLFQVMFILQNTPPATHRPSGLSMTEVDVSLEAAKYDITLSLVTEAHGLTGHLEYNTDLFDDAFVERFAEHFVHLVETGAVEPDRPVQTIGLLTPAEQREILVDWNETGRPVPAPLTVHEQFRAQARATPEATAITFREEQLTYRELDERSDALAWHLAALGVGSEDLVGVCLERSAEMVVGLLAILKAGAAYVPLDPTYPAERIAFMVSDSGCKVLLTLDKQLAQLPPGDQVRVCLDRDWSAIEATGHRDLPVVAPDHLAYVIYTSGSTGRPKGVMVEHENVVNFFVGMDDRVGLTGPVDWLAVTSISFDISVLEIFWTLARGCRVVIQPDEPQANVGPGLTPRSTKPIDFSLFYFASEPEDGVDDPYRLLFEGARFADREGFSAVWVPERHFHAFGGIYPNPAVISAALAAITRNVKLRSGSVVLPLHDTLRVAEDWSVVDNISGGRVQLSFASGWHDRDFVLQPHNYAERRAVMMHQIDEVKRLWRGESITRKGGEGTPHEIHTLPRPVQEELPVFVTAAGSPDTFVRAGKAGAHLLTHLLGQTVEQLAAKIQSYREAWEEAGHPGRGIVAVMMHTFVGTDLDEVREIVWHPFREYLRSSVGLISGLAKGRGQDMRSADFTDEDMEALLDHAFERYFETSALMGTPESCLATIERLKEMDVDDIGCLIDFGIPTDKVIASLELLAQVRRRANPQKPVESFDDHVTAPEQIVAQGVTHMQCTPSYAEMLLAQPGGKEALGRLERLLVGGEALPLSLARELAAVVGGKVLNMYGPTETTIWSSTETVDGADAAVSLGRPIANTDLYVVNTDGQPVPVGVPGELLIGGKGVVRGYWRRPELTAERFVEHPVYPDQTVYRTGDLVRFRPDGRLDFLGRIDHQVKVRGHRIELGEIESLLRDHSAVREAVVVAREDVVGDKRLVGYVVLSGPTQEAESTLREGLRGRLPEWMVPQHIVVLDAMPLTPNGKVDRKGLPAPSVGDAKSDFVAPASDLERVLAEIWQEVLRHPHVGAQDNFFDLGGHSLLTVRLQARLRERLDRVVPITDIFRFPTIRSLAARLGESPSENGSEGDAVKAAAQRARARQGALAARRRARADTRK